MSIIKLLISIFFLFQLNLKSKHINVDISLFFLCTNLLVCITIVCYSLSLFPIAENVTDVTSVALASCHKGDEFSYLVLAAPTVNITNLDTSQVEQLDNIEVFKQKVVVSCQNIFNVAHNALSKPFNSLKQVVIMEHLNRHDVSDVDPTELKPKLAKFANATFARLWNSSAMKASTTLTPMVGVSMPTELEGMMGYICMGVMGTELTQKACST